MPLKEQQFEAIEPDVVGIRRPGELKNLEEIIIWSNNLAIVDPSMATLPAATPSSSVTRDPSQANTDLEVCYPFIPETGTVQILLEQLLLSRVCYK